MTVLHEGPLWNGINNVAKVHSKELVKQADVVQFVLNALNRWMPEMRREVCLKVAKFLKEARDLHDDAKEVLARRMILHLEPFDRLIVLDHRVKALLFKLLPVTA